jgi:hypothetical protein
MQGSERRGKSARVVADPAKSKFTEERSAHAVGGAELSAAEAHRFRNWDHR